MTETWREGVKIVRGTTLDRLTHDPAGNGRATAFDFAGTGGQQTWIGSVSLKPNANTGAHHHGRHEVMIYVARGQCEIRWGDKLEYAANIAPGDFVYFTPDVPHQERNLSTSEPVDFVVVRSDNQRIVLPVETDPIEKPELL